MKQIAGRAGRYGSIYDKGVVTAMDKHALKYIRTKLLNETTPIHVISHTCNIFRILTLNLTACRNFPVVRSNRNVRSIFTEKTKVLRSTGT